MFRTSLCPLSGEPDHVLLHMVLCTGCAGCGCVQLGRKLCSVHTDYDQTSTSTCFGHHYAHHHENQTMYYCIWCYALVVLAVVVCSWVVSCVQCTQIMIKLLSQHVSDIIMPIITRTRPCITAYGVLHWLCWLWLCAAGS